jgi:nitrate/nitrite transport system ATP-binding protein
MHRHPNYYPIRNHLIEFLVNRSQNFRRELAAASYDPKHPPVARPAAEGHDEDIRPAKRKASM